MSEVGALIIKLQAETAQFREDMGKVKSDLDDLGNKGGEAGGKMAEGMGEARGGLMLTEDMVGVRLPRHLNALIAQIPGVGAAFATMLPIVGVFVAIEIITKLIEKHKEAAEAAQKLHEAEENFGTAVENVFNKLDDKLLEAGIKSDELEGNHLAALQKRLQLINNQSMSDLVQEFNTVSAAAEKTLGSITQHWYESKIGVVGVKDALENFKLQYASLLAQHKDKEATDLLKGTLDSAVKMKELMEAQQGGHGSTQSNLDAQNALVGALTAQLGIEQRMAELKKAQLTEAGDKTDKEIGRDQDTVLKEQARAAKQAAEDEEKAWEENYKRAVSALETAEREKIAATRQGTNERIAAIDAAIKEENSKGLQETSYYKGLLVERVAAEKAMADETARVRAALSDEELRHDLVMAKLQQVAQDGAMKHELAMKKATLQQITDAEIKAVRGDTQIEVNALNARIAALDKNDKDYLKKLQEFENKKKEITQKAENEITKIRQTAEEKQAHDVLAAETRMKNAVLDTAVQSMFQFNNMSKAFEHLGEEMIQHALTNLLQMSAIDRKKELMDAKSAAKSAFKWVMQDVPFPANAVLAPISAAAAFAGVMAFEQGGEIPGAGAVPIIAHGGETVVTKALTDQVKNSTQNNSNTSHETHFNIDARGADAGVEKRIHGVLKQLEQRVVARSVAAVQDRAGRR